jgi:hypothetical protein
VETGAPDEPAPPVAECPGLVRVVTGCDEGAGWVALACPGLGRVVTGCAAVGGWAGVECPGLDRVATGAAGCACDAALWDGLTRVVPA